MSRQLAVGGAADTGLGQGELPASWWAELLTWQDSVWPAIFLASLDPQPELRDWTHDKVQSVMTWKASVRLTLLPSAAPSLGT